MKKLLLLLTICNLYFIHSECCTIFYATNGEKTYVGNNEDFLTQTKGRIWFEPGKGDKYGVAYWGFDYFPFKAHQIPQGGVNEHGLFFDKTAVPEQDLVKVKSRKNSGPFFFNDILKKCETVQDVRELISQYNLKFFTKGQILFVDKSGDCIIVENNHIAEKDGDYCVVTNFRTSDPGMGGYPSRKYSGAVNMLKKNFAPTFSNFERILDEVSEVGIENSTIYSQICDLESGMIRLYQQHNFEEFIELDLKRELAKGKHSYLISGLFKPSVLPELTSLFYQYGIDSTLSYVERLKMASALPAKSVLYIFAESLLESHNKSSFPAFCEAVLSWYPNDDKTMLLYGKYLLSEGKMELGQGLINQAYQCNPDNYIAGTICKELTSQNRSGNTLFHLDGYQNAQSVTLCLANENWADFQHIMVRKNGGWEYALDLYPGQYQYIYKVDGKYAIDTRVDDLVEYSTTNVMLMKVGQK